VRALGEQVALKDKEIQAKVKELTDVTLILSKRDKEI
jgi:hypothetical protein